MIEEIKPESPYYDQVVLLGNANSKTLGFLPYAAISEAAADGRVLGSVTNGIIQGYVLFARRVRRGDISLTHLCIGQEHRGLGIARELVDAIIERHPQRAGIRLSCRKDYDAHRMWPKLGFTAWGERPGRSRAGLPLITWWRPIAAPTLFDIMPDTEDDRLLVALDSEIFREICADETIHDSRALTADWVEEVAELAVTEDTASRWPGAENSETAPRRVDGFRVLTSDPQATLDRLSGLPSEALDSLSRCGVLTTICQASGAGATYLLTRNAEALRHGDAIERLTGLTTMHPGGFLLQLHSRGDERDYRTRIIAASGLSISQSFSIPPDQELTSLCQPYSDERFAELKSRLTDTACRTTGRLDEIVNADGSRLALAASYRENDRVAVPVLRSSAFFDVYTCMRQLAHHLRVTTAAEGPTQVRVVDQVDVTVARALSDEGFRKLGDAWVADVRTAIHGPDDSLPDELDADRLGQLTPERVSAYERYMWPSKIFTGVVRSYVVPIQPEYARVLLGYEEAQGRLFEEHEFAAAARENVYYRYPRRLVAPARLLWWVSGGGSTGGMRALSWLDGSDTGDPYHLHQRYRHRGVLSKQDVVNRARTSTRSCAQSVTALLFSRTEVFPQPVPLPLARTLEKQMQRPGYFQTMNEIDEVSVMAFYKEGMMRNE